MKLQNRMMAMIGNQQMALSSVAFRFALSIIMLGAVASVDPSELLAQPMGDDHAKSLFANMIAERERLRTGDVQVRGKVAYRQSQDGKISSSVQAINEEIVFDHLHGWIRHKVETNPKTDGENDTDASSSSHIVNILGPDASYQLQVEAKVISISNRQQVKAFDLRAIGLFSFVDLQSPPSLTECVSRLNGQGISISKDDANRFEILNIEFVDKSGDEAGIRPVMRRRIWIDVEHGYTPVRLEDQMWNDQASKWSSSHALTTVDWSQIESVWAPVSAVLEIRKGNANRLRHNTFEVAFDWRQVNKEPDALGFTLDGLDVPSGSHLVVDSRIDPYKATILQVPSVPNALELQ